MAESKSSDADATAELAIGSEDIVQPLCNPCRIDRLQVPADGFCKTCMEYLCGACYKYHCKPTPMRHHVLVDAQNMPKSKSIAEDGCYRKCVKHKQMPLKIFCKSHNDFGCIVCLSEEHSVCGNVSFIQDCAKGVAESEAYQNFQSELTSLQAAFKSEIGHAETNLKNINDVSKKLNIAEAISCLYLLINYLKDLEKKTNEAKASSVIMKCDQSLKQLDNLLSDETSDVLKFMSMKQGQLIITQATTCLESVKTDNKLAREKGFLNDLQQCQSLLQKVKTCLGSQTEYSVSSTSANIQDHKAQQMKDVIGIKVISTLAASVNLDESDNECRVIGSTVLSDGRVAFADFSNETVKIMNPFYILALKTLAKPFDLTELEPGRIAITLPSQSRIDICIVDKDEVYASGSYIKTSGSCYGIASMDSVIYVSIDKPPKVVVINIGGDVLKTFAMDDNMQSLFNSPWYVALDPARERIYVTDRDNDTLTCLTKDGTVVKVYTSCHIKRPYGVAVDGPGMIFVCSRLVDKLVCLDADFREVEIIEHDGWLHKAESVAVSIKQDRLYIGLFEDNEMTVMDIHKCLKNE